MEEGLVRCADDPHVDRIHAIAADTQDLSRFQHAQQAPSYSAPAAAAPQQGYGAPVQTPPSADVYDEDIPF